MVLIISQLLAGVGVASGFAVGGLLAEKIAGTVTMAGFGQTASLLGAGIVAIPLARLAARRGRRWALTTGYVLAVVGAVLILLAAMTNIFPILLVGLGAFGAAQASGLQSRFAATEVVKPAFQATAMSIVLWSTTIGSVAGPNLSQLGADLGAGLGLEPLAGPYVFSLVSFALAALLIGLFLRTPAPGHLEDDAVQKPKSVGLIVALKSARRHPPTLFALMAITGSHMIMVGVMVMTPVHMAHQGLSLDMVGIVISVHILGMYAASPVMGWLTDKIGAGRVIAMGMGIFMVSMVLGATAGPDDTLMLGAALGVLGLGWSAGLIGGSALLTRSASPETRVPLQGASDAIMNIAAAVSAAVSGVVLAWGGYLALNSLAALVLVPMFILGLAALRSRRASVDRSAAPKS